MGDKDDYLDVFVQDMVYSDQPIKKSISEDLADIYQDLKDFIYNKAKTFTDELLDKLKEHGFEMRINPNIFMGGGSLLLKQFIEKRNEPFYMEFLDQFSNVRGYETLTKQSVEKGRWKFEL